MHIEQNIDDELRRLHVTARRMDALFYIPGTRISVGWDNILGLVPVFGDALAVMPALWIVWKAKQLGATPGTLAYMTLNVLIDYLIGLVPVIGDLFDMIYNANIRNVRALEVNLGRQTSRAATVDQPILSV